MNTSFTQKENESQKLAIVLSKKINSQSIPDDLLREYTQFLISFNKALTERKEPLQMVKKTIAAVLLFFVFGTTMVKSQCATSPTVPACNPPGSTALASADVVSAGQVKTINSNIAVTSLSISGGTLIVCSNATVAAFAFSSGVLIVNPGANLIINNGGSAIVFGNNCSIFNFGNLTFNVSIVTGQNNIMHNASVSSILTVAFNQFVLQGPNTFVVNNGIFNSGYFIVQPNNSPDPVCSGLASAIVTNFMINQYANAFASPAGISCIQITQQIINNQPMTATPNINICYNAPGVSVVSGPNFGNATVNNACTSCGVILPLHITGFSGTCDSKKVYLEWKTENAYGADHFDVERSFDGLHYETVGTMPVSATGALTETYHFGTENHELGSTVFYYRIKQVDLSGSVGYTKSISVNCNSEDELNIAPSITENYFTVSSIHAMDLVTVYDGSGRLVHKSNYPNVNFFTTVVNNTLARGVYLVRVRTSEGKTFNKKIVFN